MFFLVAHAKFVTLGEAERKHPEIFNRRLVIDFDFQVANELVERKIDLVLFLRADRETELHLKFL